MRYQCRTRIWIDVNLLRFLRSAGYYADLRWKQKSTRIRYPFYFARDKTQYCHTFIKNIDFIATLTELECQDIISLASVGRNDNQIRGYDKIIFLSTRHLQGNWIQSHHNNLIAAFFLSLIWSKLINPQSPDRDNRLKEFRSGHSGQKYRNMVRLPE